MAIDRREFLARYLGNVLLGLGGSALGAAAAYEVYKNRAEADLASLKRGRFVLPTVAAQPTAEQSASASQAEQATPGDASPRSVTAVSATSSAEQATPT